MVDGVESNLVVILDLFDGNIFKALDKVRKHNRIEVTMSAKSLERLAIKVLIANSGYSDKQISEMLSKEENIVGIDRVRRIRKEMGL